MITYQDIKSAEFGRKCYSCDKRFTQDDYVMSIMLENWHSEYNEADVVCVIDEGGRVEFVSITFHYSCFSAITNDYLIDTTDKELIKHIND